MLGIFSVITRKENNMRTIEEYEVEIQAKMSMIVANYFKSMARTFATFMGLVKRNGHVVFKISDSNVRGLRVPTHAIYIELMKTNGFHLVDSFVDQYDQNSRSLLMSRNYYSGRMDSDWILIFQKGTR